MDQAAGLQLGDGLLGPGCTHQFVQFSLNAFRGGLRESVAVESQERLCGSGDGEAQFCCQAQAPQQPEGIVDQVLFGDCCEQTRLEVVEATGGVHQARCGGEFQGDGIDAVVASLQVSLKACSFAAGQVDGPALHHQASHIPVLIEHDTGASMALGQLSRLP